MCLQNKAVGEDEMVNVLDRCLWNQEENNSDNWG